MLRTSAHKYWIRSAKIAREFYILVADTIFVVSTKGYNRQKENCDAYMRNWGNESRFS